MASVEELLAQMAAGVSLEELARKAAPSAMTDLLDRCAWVPAFDRDVFERLRRETPRAVDMTFEQVVAQPDVRPVPGREDCFRVRTRARERAFRQLAPHGKVPPDLVRLSADLAAHFRARGEELAELEMLIVSDPSAARSRLEELYEAADQYFDSARCQALLDVVHSRGDVPDWELVKLQNRLERYLCARLYWRAAYRRTSRFLIPDGSEDALEALLATNPPHTLQVFGTGGMGKTMHLNALVARMAVPEPARLCCAIIDLDLLQLGNAVRRPWLVLVEIAHQLNQQLYEPLFDRFLAQHGKLRAHLLRPHLLGDAIPGQLSLDLGEEGRIAKDVSREFFETIETGGGGSDLLLVFDTLERVTHVDDVRTTGDPSGILDQLRTLRTLLPQARMVLSGRYDLRSELDDLETRFGAMRHLELHRLGEGEAERYLRHKRKLRAGDDVIAAALDSAKAAEEGALPFKLALLADAIAQRPDTTAEEIRELREPELIYVIKRVVDRIDDFPLRWMLLFGVIPRLLSRQFAIEVMTPYLERAVRGVSHDVGQALASAGAAGSFQTRPDATVDPDELWKKLMRYAASYSWVDMVAPDVLRFHPDVIGPLRYLVCREPVFKKINADAVAYFERQASADRDDRPRMLREVLFHKASVEETGLPRDWRAEVRRPNLEPAVAAALAEQVIELGTEPDSKISADAVAEARVERALATLRLATAPGAPRGGATWDQAREDVEAAERIQSPRGPRLSAARAALLINDGHTSAAIELLEPLRSTPSPDDRLIIHIRYADALAQQGRRDADKQYRSALRQARKLGVREEDLAVLAWKRATALDRRDDLKGATETCNQALALAPSGGPAYAALSLLHGQVALRCGHTSSVRDRVAAALEHGGRLAHEARLLRVCAELSAWAPETALGLVDDAVRVAAEDDADSAEAGIRLAEARELRGTVRSQLLEIGGAVEDLEAAGLLWDSISSEGARRSHLKIAEIYLHDLEDLDRAMLALAQAEKVPGEQGGEDSAKADLLHAEWKARAGIDQPEELVDAALVELAKCHAPPGVRARAGLDALALGLSRPPERWLEEINARLAEVTPAAARLAMLGGLERCPVLHDQYDAGDLRQLRRLVAGASIKADVERLAPRDRHLRLVRLAEVARVTGRTREARRLIAEADHILPPGKAERYARQRFLAAAERADAEDVVASRLAFEKAEWEAAIARREVGSLAKRIRTLLQAAGERLYQRAGLTSRWMARTREVMSWMAAHGVDPGLPESPLPTPMRELPARRPQRSSAREGIDLHLDLRDDTMTIRTDGPELHLVRLASDWPLVKLLIRASLRRGGVDRELAHALTDPRAAGMKIGAQLLDSSELDHLRGDMRIWTDGGVLDQLPWELARVAPSGQLLSLDRRFGHLLRAQCAVRNMPRPVRHGPARVMIVRPLERDRRSFRGMIKTTLVPLEERYLQAGLAVEVLETVDLTSVQEAIQSGEPDVLHIVGGFVEASGDAAIDISSGTAGTLHIRDVDKERLTTSGLALALGSNVGVDPVLVLDPPALVGTTELAAQLLLRNAFAAELARIVPLPAIVAAGLVSYNAQDALYRELILGLATQRAVADIVDAIRALATEERTEDGYGLAATALFTAKPDHALS